MKVREEREQRAAIEAINIERQSRSVLFAQALRPWREQNTVVVLAAACGNESAEGAARPKAKPETFMEGAGRCFNKMKARGDRKTPTRNLIELANRPAESDDNSRTTAKPRRTRPEGGQTPTGTSWNVFGFERNENRDFCTFVEFCVDFAEI